jgi:TRAP-type mannitol/chloroaromatic compound transport system substrate-binding protein
MHFNEVAKYVYISASRAPSDPQVFYVNKDAWAKLPEDIKVIVQALIAQHTQDQHEFLVADSIKAVEKFKAAGNEVVRVPKEIEDALLAEADKFYAEKSKSEKPIFAEIYNSMTKFGKDYAMSK